MYDKNLRLLTKIVESILLCGNQNELFEIIGQYIRKQMLDSVKGKEFYSIIVDEVADKYSNQEVLALCLRFVDESQTEPCIREELFDCVHLERTTGENIARNII